MFLSKNQWKVTYVYVYVYVCSIVDMTVDLLIQALFLTTVCPRSIVGTVKEVGFSLNIMTTAANWIYTILNVMSKLVII